MSGGTFWAVCAFAATRSTTAMPAAIDSKENSLRFSAAILKKDATPPQSTPSLLQQHQLQDEGSIHAHCPQQRVIFAMLTVECRCKYPSDRRLSPPAVILGNRRGTVAARRRSRETPSADILLRIESLEYKSRQTGRSVPRRSKCCVPPAQIRRRSGSTRDRVGSLRLWAGERVTNTGCESV